MQSTPEYARSGPSTRRLDSLDGDSEWRRGVDEQLSYTVFVLKQVLARLEQPQPPLPPGGSIIPDPASRGCQARREPTSTAINGGGPPLQSEDKAPLPMMGIAVTSLENRVEDAIGSGSGVGVTVDTSAREDNNEDSREDDILHADVEQGANETHMSDEMERVLRGEDPDFQAPQQVPGRASRSRAHVPPVSQKTVTIAKKNTKRGTPTLSQPPIPPSHPGRLEPKSSSDAVPVGKTCWILHPEYPSQVVAYGKTGPHWRSKGQRLAGFCTTGQQMVQIHGVFATSVPLMFLEPERQPFQVLEDAVTPVAGSGIHVLWDTRYVVRYKVDAVEASRKLQD